MPPTLSPSERIAAAAELLRDARLRGTRLDRLPGALHPADVGEGLAIQDGFLALNGRPSVGWKLGGTTAATRGAFGTEEVFFGVLLEGMIWQSPVTLPGSGFFQLGVEPEITIALGVPIEPRAEPYTAADLADCVETAHFSIEVPNSCIRDAVGVGLPTLLADNCGAGALVLGSRLEGWDARLASLPVTLKAGGEVLATGSTADVTGGPLAALAALANRLGAMGRSLPAGSLIATGGCTLYSMVQPDCPVEAEFGDLGTVSLTFQGPPVGN